MKTRLIVLLMLLTTLITAQTMWNNALPIRQGTNIEWSRTSATTDDGGIIYVWSSTQFGGRDLFAMKFDEQGNSEWGEDPITIDNKVDRQEAPVIIKTSDNCFVIAWIDYSLDQDGDVFAQKINNDGELLWENGGVSVCTNAEDQYLLQIAANSIGGAYLVWQDYRSSSPFSYAANLDTNGTNLWEEDGKLIATSIYGTYYDDEIKSTIADGDGGFIIGYLAEYDETNNNKIFIKRYNSAGESVWGEPIAISPTTGSQSDIKAIEDGTGGFIFVWREREATSTSIFAQRLLSDGSIDWSEDLQVYSGVNYGQYYPQIESDGMGNIIVAWEDESEYLVRGIYAQKISTSGDLLWTEGGIEIIDNHVRDATLRIDSDSNGGVYTIWTDLRNGDFPQVDIYAQHLNAEGTLQWSEDGRAICTSPNEQNNPLIKSNNGNIFAVWLDARTGSNGINQQIIDTSDNPLLAANGETVFYGLSGDAGRDELIEALPRPTQNDVVVIWLDTRTASNCYQIFFQYINPDGTVDLETNGRSITTFTDFKKYEFSAAVNDAGETIVVWSEQRGYYKKVYAQLIDVNGNYLWGDEGIEMSSAFTAGQEDPRVSYYNGDFYLGWSDNMITDQGLYIKQVFGQRFSNGEKQWGENGIQLSSISTIEDYTDIELYDLIGNYYIWNLFQVDRRVAKVNEDGQVMEGYSIDGNHLAQEDGYVDWGGNGAINNNTLYYSWIDNREDQLNTVFTQGLADDGSFTWQEEILTSLHNYDGLLNESQNPDLAIGDAIYVTWDESTTGYNDNIKAQKINFSGEKQFAEEGLMIAEGDFSQINPKIAKINNGNYVIVWEQVEQCYNSDLYLNLLRDNGETLNGSTGIPLTTELNDQKSVRIAPMPDNKAFFVWADGRSSGKTSILGVYAQYVDFSAVSNEDNNNAQIVTSTLAQNYPNPFNPTTKISFNLAKDVKNVELAIYNLKGQKVKTLVRDDFSKGSYSYVWNGQNEENSSVASGVYFYKLKAGNQTSTKKMVLMK